MITSLSVETRLFIGTCIIVVLVMLWRIAILWKRGQRTRPVEPDSAPPNKKQEWESDIDWKGDEHKSEND